MSTETTMSPDVLEELDFATPCSCASTCCAHTTQHGMCGDPAALIVTLHKLDHCTDEHCDADGNTIGPICRTCLARITKEVTEAIARMRRNSRPACWTCAAPIVLVSDVIRDVRPL